MYIKKTGNVYKTLEFAEESFVKVFRSKCNAELDVADLFKGEKI